MTDIETKRIKIQIGKAVSILVTLKNARLSVTMGNR